MLAVHYVAYGLRWSSQIRMPELQIAPKDAETDFDVVDVHIESSDLTPLWEDWDVGNDNFVARDGSLFSKSKMQACF